MEMQFAPGPGFLWPGRMKQATKSMVVNSYRRYKQPALDDQKLYNVEEL